MHVLFDVKSPTLAADGVEAIRFLISAAIVMKAASTLVASAGAPGQLHQ